MDLLPILDPGFCDDLELMSGNEIRGWWVHKTRRESKRSVRRWQEMFWMESSECCDRWGRGCGLEQTEAAMHHLSSPRGALNLVWDPCVHSLDSTIALHWFCIISKIQIYMRLQPFIWKMNVLPTIVKDFNQFLCKVELLCMNIQWFLGLFLLF